MRGIPKELRIPAQLIFRSKITHHTAYFENVFKRVADKHGMSVIEDEGLGFPTPLSFEIGIGPLKCAVDYNDLSQLPPCAGEFDFWLKFHTTSEHTPFDNVLPFPPCSFLDWNRYELLQKEIRYTAKSDKVLNCQRTNIVIRARQWTQDLTARRTMVQQKLKESYADMVDTDFSDQDVYWKKANNCLVSVHVPGMWNNMLDRAQIQMMGFGVCTISPTLYTKVSTTNHLHPGVHYIACRDDYSDLIDKIEWCRKNREVCREIGVNAKNFFLENCTPESIWSQIGKNTIDKVIQASG